MPPWGQITTLFSFFVFGKMKMQTHPVEYLPTSHRLTSCHFPVRSSRWKSQRDFNRFGCTKKPWFALLALCIDPVTFRATWQSPTTGPPHKDYFRGFWSSTFVYIYIYSNLDATTWSPNLPLIGLAFCQWEFMSIKKVPMTHSPLDDIC